MCVCGRGFTVLVHGTVIALAVDWNVKTIDMSDLRLYRGFEKWKSTYRRVTDISSRGMTRPIRSCIPSIWLESQLNGTITMFGVFREKRSL